MKPTIKFLLHKVEPFSYIAIGIIITIIVIMLYNLIVSCNYTSFMAFCGYIGLIAGFCSGVLLVLGLFRWYVYEY